MNEKFIELMREAKINVDQLKTFPGGFPREDLVVLEDYAELILRDIDQIIDDLYHQLPLEQAVVLLTLNENIKSHFYLKENKIP